jgi:hypothetical protein
MVDKTDIWWKKNWNHADVRELEVYFSPGVHSMEIYGIELCCDGNQDI